MSAAGGRDQSRRLVLIVGVVVVALAVGLSVFMRYQPRDPGPLEEVPCAMAVPALYLTVGLLAIIGALQRRPAIVAASGLLCLVGAILSVATIAFVVPGVVLLVLVGRIPAMPRRRLTEPVIAAAAVLLVVGAAGALLGMTEGRCWQATGSPADPRYTVIPCGGQAVLIAGARPSRAGSTAAC